MTGIPGPPPAYVPVSPERSAAIRTTCVRTGRGVVVLSVILAAVAVVLALVQLPANGFVAAIMLSAGVTGAALGVLAGTALSSAPSHLHGERLDVVRARTVRRLLLLQCIMSMLVAGLFYAGLVALARTSDIAVGPVTVALLLPPIASCVLTGIAYVTAYRVVRPG